jgi:hypothetical protein
VNELVSLNCKKLLFDKLHLANVPERTRIVENIVACNKLLASKTVSFFKQNSFVAGYEFND